MPTVRILRPGDEDVLMRFLLRRPDTTMFLRGNVAAAGLVDRGQRYEGTYAAAFEESEIVGAAGLFWNGVVIMEAPADLEGVLTHLVRNAPRGVQGLIGVGQQVGAARRLLGLEDAPTNLDSQEILYRLDLEDVRVPAALADGGVTCRRANEGDLPTVVPWGCDYHVETLGGARGRDLETSVEQGQRATLRDGRLWVLEQGGEPVSMTGFNATTADCVQVGGVYTPPALRSKGFARAAVAGSLLDARAEGVERSILFTDEANAPARACYERLGYEAIGDYALCLFRDAHDVRI